MREGHLVYLAGRFIRKDELVGYIPALNAIGYGVPARWLTTPHDSTDPVLMAQYAQEDLEDLYEADIVIVFTEQPRPDVVTEAQVRAAVTENVVGTHVNTDGLTKSLNAAASPVARGGRHVEYGLAMALRKLTIVVGPVENVFHTQSMFRFDTFEEALTMLKGYNQ